MARRESVVRNRRRQPVKKESYYTEEKENGHKALAPGARSLVRVQSERKIFPRARLRSSTTPSLNVATRPAKRKKTHGREEREERAAAEKKESHSPRREKEKRRTRSGPLTLNRTVRRF